MNTHEIGRQLENYICEKFKEAGYPNARPSNGSGNKGSVGDVSGVADFAVEAKLRNTKNITIQQDVWDKLVCEIPLSSERTALYILENKNGHRFVVLDIKDFFDILKDKNEKMH